MGIMDPPGELRRARACGDHFNLHSQPIGDDEHTPRLFSNIGTTPAEYLSRLVPVGIQTRITGAARLLAYPIAIRARASRRSAVQFDRTSLPASADSRQRPSLETKKARDRTWLRRAAGN